MALTDDSALRNLSQFILNSQALQQSPDKTAHIDDLMQNVINGLPIFAAAANTSMDVDVDNQDPDAQVTKSSSSVSPREDSPESALSPSDQPQNSQLPTTASSSVSSQSRPYRVEPWHECFQTRSAAEFDALIYSVYVMQRDERKLDGYDYYECINRLQSKCKYRVRTKRVNEFYIVEEKSFHNHSMEPVGSPGSHAGLPKTLREIVDLSFKEEWPAAKRTQKLDEEVKRLGLPHNPRLGRQVDNRIAYLRRVKNLSEMRKVQDQLAPLTPTQLNSSSNDPISFTASSEELMRMMAQLSQQAMPNQTQQPQELTSPQQAGGATVQVSSAQPLPDELLRIMMQIQQSAASNRDMDPSQLLSAFSASTSTQPQQGPLAPTAAETAELAPSSSSSPDANDHLQVDN